MYLTKDGWSCWCRLCKYCNLICGVWKGGRLAKGGAVANRPGTSMNGYLPPWAKKRVLQVSTTGMMMSKGLGWMRL
jgi:hypothetical protein